MFIQSEETPNPETLKFIPGTEVCPEGSRFYAQNHEATDSPLAQRLFALQGVQAVFLGADFISVTKEGAAEWYLLKPSILGALMDHHLSDAPAVVAKAAAAPAHNHKAKTADTPVIAQIKELLETRVRPAVNRDGGDIVFHGFSDGVVTLYLQGACAGCPSSTMTLKMGIENLLRHYVPEVTEVRALET